MKYTNHPLKGKFIKVLTKEHGAKVISWFRSQGVGTTHYQGTSNEHDRNTFIYYGINKRGEFVQYTLDTIKHEKYEIIELPTELTFPRKMLVWSSHKSNAVERIVLWHNTNGNPTHPYLSVLENFESSFYSGDKYETILFTHAEELKPTIEEMTLEQVCRELGRDIKIIK